MMFGKNDNLVLIAIAFVVLVLALGACRNDAITFAHAIDPTADCRAIETKGETSDGDSAVCRSHAGHTWFCFAVKGMTSCLEGNSVVMRTCEASSCPLEGQP